MTHSFNVNFAKDHGVNEAIFIHNIEFWTRTNLANRRHLHDGLCWTYNTLNAFAEILPYYSPKQIERLIIRLIEKGLLLKGNYNKNTYDRTAWYAMTPRAYEYYKDTLTDEYKIIMNSSYPQDSEKSPYFPISRNREMDSPKSGNGFPEIGKSITDINTYNKTDIKNARARPNIYTSKTTRIETIPMDRAPRSAVNSQPIHQSVRPTEEQKQRMSEQTKRNAVQVRDIMNKFGLSRVNPTVNECVNGDKIELEALSQTISSQGANQVLSDEIVALK